jgi:hypothetical protein
VREGPKLVTVVKASGPVLISTDLHGNHEDFAALRDLFLAAEGRGEAPLWISVGDWLHGPPAGARRGVIDRHGRSLYDYVDRSPEILAELFALMDRFPARVLSLCGNHEHAHIGGPVTSKFHADEAAALEARLAPELIAELRRRFASWPIVIRLASCGVVVTHGAPPAVSAAEIERARFRGGAAAERALLLAATTRYGFDPGEDRALLERLSEPGQPPYTVIIHGHDREEEGHARTGDAALLLCTSFGARRERKSYLWLDLGCRYPSLDALREGKEIRRLYPESPPRASSSG